MNEEHRDIRESLGAYVVGALDPADRHRVDEHLSGCETCRESLAGLSVLPPLLGRLGEHEATDDRLLPSPGLSDELVRSAGAETRRLERALWRWRVAAGVAAAGVVVLAVLGVTADDPTPPMADRVVASAVAESPAARDTEGTAAAIAWEWGTTVELDVSALPPRDAYVLWAVGDDGRREQAGTWGPTAHHGARVRGASAIPRDRLARVVVADGAGEQLLSFRF